MRYEQTGDAAWRSTYKLWVKVFVLSFAGLAYSLFPYVVIDRLKASGGDPYG